MLFSKLLHYIIHSNISLIPDHKPSPICFRDLLFFPDRFRGFLPPPVCFPAPFCFLGLRFFPAPFCFLGLRFFPAPVCFPPPFCFFGFTFLPSSCLFFGFTLLSRSTPSLLLSFVPIFTIFFHTVSHF